MISSLLLLLACCTTPSQGAPSRELAILLFRHGDRSPSNPYANYPHASAWPQGYGQLTIEGMQEQYSLGEFIKQTYISSGYLLSAYRPAYSYIRSTDVDRTIMSAQAQLSAVFPPTGDQVWNSSILWQPIPVHTVSADTDNILKAYSANCPAYTDAVTEYTTSQEFKEMSKKHQSLFKTISDATNDTVNLTNIWQFADTSFCDKQHNITLPAWAEDNFDTLESLNDWNLKTSFAREEVKKFISGRLMWYFWQLIDARMNNSVGLKAYFLSAHDVTVIGLLSALNIWNEIQPPYASLVMADLYRDGNKWSIQFSYKNSTDKNAFILRVPGCDSDMCSVDKLKEITRNITLTEDEWRRACRLDSYDGLDLAVLPYIIAIVVLGFVCIFLCFVWILIIPCKRLGRPKYQKLQTE